LDLLRLEIHSKFGSYGKIGNDNERRPNMHQQNLIYIYKVQKRNEMKKEEKLTGLQWGSAVAAGVKQHVKESPLNMLSNKLHLEFFH